MTRNVLITGGNSGIGAEMAKALAARGDRVLIAARDQARSQAVVADIRAAHPQAQIEALPLDLGDFADVDRFADAVRAHTPVIDVLILNAGLFSTKLATLRNGYESMIGVMHFGHFKLVQRLLDAVKAAPQGRIVVTSSMMHALSGIDERSFTEPGRHSATYKAYAQAKLANLLFARELQRRLAGTRVTVNAFHPGAVATGIYRGMPGWVQSLIRMTMLTPAQGADTAIWLATAPELAERGGGYYVKRKLKPGSARSRDPQLAAQLWALTERRLATG